MALVRMENWVLIISPRNQHVIKNSHLVVERILSCCSKMEKKRITYYFGAGASHERFPIQHELPYVMNKVANLYMNNQSRNNQLDFSERLLPNKFSSIDEGQTKDGKHLAWNIGHFAQMAINDGWSIDNYAYQLHLNGKSTTLEKLKYALSSFFTLWEVLPAKSKELIRKQVSTQFKENTPSSNIDHRYKPLIVQLLRSSNSSSSKHELPENVNFISWNYDLQFQQALINTIDSLNWETIEEALPFNPLGSDLSKLKLFHLNGFHGFRSKGGWKGEVNLFSDLLNEMGIENRTVHSVINHLSVMWESVSLRRVTFGKHLKYGIEHDNLLNSPFFERVKNIIERTDILVVVGYSFPDENRLIDCDLFRNIGSKSSNQLQIIIKNPSGDPSIVAKVLNREQEWSNGEGKLKITLDKETTSFIVA